MPSYNTPYYNIIWCVYKTEPTCAAPTARAQSHGSGIPGMQRLKRKEKDKRNIRERERKGKGRKEKERRGKGGKERKGKKQEEKRAVARRAEALA